MMHPCGAVCMAFVFRFAFQSIVSTRSLTFCFLFRYHQRGQHILQAQSLLPHTLCSLDGASHQRQGLVPHQTFPLGVSPLANKPIDT